MDALIDAVAANLDQDLRIVVEYEPIRGTILVYPQASGERMLREWHEQLDRNPGAMPGCLDYRDMFFVEVEGDKLIVKCTDEESVEFELSDPSCFRNAADLICQRAYSQ